jgi:CubicO group peptidase (beta-lactamase class C family)
MRQLGVVLAAFVTSAAAIFSTTQGLAQDAPASEAAPISSAASAPAPATPPAVASPKPAPPPVELKAPTPARAPPQPQARLAPGQTIPAAELEAFVDGLAAQAMADRHIAGAVVAVVQNGQVLLKKGYGSDRLAPARPVDPDRTLFRLGPLTETFTWIALMREIEAGHMRLDAPISVYLPQKDQVPDQGYRRQVLTRDLLTHSAGFEDRSLGQLMEKDPDRIRPPEVYLAQERPRRVREAGSLPSYSNYDAALAGEALSQVTGKTMQALTEVEVFTPLGLRRTTLREPYPRRPDLSAPMGADLAGDVSKGFRWTGAALKPRPFEYMTHTAASGSASSTAADMSRFMLAVLGDGALDGAVIYSPALAKGFRTPLQRAAPGAMAIDNGVFEFALPGGYVGYGRQGGTLSFQSSQITIPQLGLGVFVSANTDTARPFVDSLTDRIVQQFYAAPLQSAAVASPWLKDNAAAFSGTYVTTDRSFHGLEGFVDLLQGGQTLSVTDDGVLITSGAEGPRRWTPDPSASLDAPFVSFHEVGGPRTLVFKLKDGEAQEWYAPGRAEAFERSGIMWRPWVLIITAIAVAACALTGIAGLFLRDRREFRQTSIQGKTDAAQLSASALWLAAMGGYFIFRLGAPDAARLMYGWPGPWLVLGSACAFVATVLSFLCLGLQPVVWRGGRRLDSWTTARKARFAATTLIFSFFGVLLGLWGALEPWSS